MTEHTELKSNIPINKLILRSEKERIEIRTTFNEVFERLYKTSKDFQSAIDGPLPILAHLNWGDVHLLDEILFDWERRKIFYKNGSHRFLKEFTMLVNLCKKLNSEYKTYVLLCRHQDADNSERIIEKELTFILGPFCDYRGNVSQYRVKGMSIERVLASRRGGGGIEDFKEYKNDYFDEIRIDDLNSLSSRSRNALTDGIAQMSKITPTLIKYANREGDKSLLISLPKNLDVTTFLNEYGRMLSKIHGEFYQKRFRRPRTKKQKADLILKILEEKYGHEENAPSINEMLEFVAPRLKEMGVKGSTLGNLMRNFRETVIGFRDAKNSQSANIIA